MKIKNDMKKRAIKTLFIIAAGALFIYYIRAYSHDFVKMSQIRPLDFFIISLLFACGLFVQGWAVRILLGTFGADVGLNECFGLSAVNGMLNYITLKTGPLARGFYLKKVYGMGYDSFFTAILFLSLVQIFCAATLSLSVFLASFMTKGIINFRIALLFTTVMSLSAAPFFMTKNFQHRFVGRFGILKKLHDNWFKLRWNIPLILKVAALTYCALILFSLRIFFAYRIVTEGVAYSQCILMASTGYLSLFLALTPASIGIKEALMGYMAGLSGGVIPLAVVASSIDRIIATFWFFLLGGVYGARFMKKIR